MLVDPAGLAATDRLLEEVLDRLAQGTLARRP